jgi:hypothetical protein
MAYAMDSSIDAFEGIAGNTLQYANKGLKGSGAMSFTAEQRSSAGEASVIGDDVKAISEVEAALKRAKAKSKNVTT